MTCTVTNGHIVVVESAETDQRNDMPNQKMSCIPLGQLSLLGDIELARSFCVLHGEQWKGRHGWSA